VVGRVVAAVPAVLVDGNRQTDLEQPFAVIAGEIERRGFTISRVVGEGRAERDPVRLVGSVPIDTRVDDRVLVGRATIIEVHDEHLEALAQADEVGLLVLAVVDQRRALLDRDEVQDLPLPHVGVVVSRALEGQVVFIIMKVRRVAVDARDAVDERSVVVVAQITRIIIRVVEDDARVRVAISLERTLKTLLVVGLARVDATQVGSLVVAVHLDGREREELVVAVFTGMVVDRRGVDLLHVLQLEAEDVLVGARGHVQLLNDVDVVVILINLDGRRLLVAVPHTKLLVVPAELGDGAVLRSY